jgi:hypothetical protein
MLPRPASAAAAAEPRSGEQTSMSAARSRLAVLVLATALGALTIAAAAQAAEIDLACTGKGPHSKDSAGTVLCAAAPGKARVVSGVLRDDAGKPVAGKVKVTFADWIPSAGGSFTVTAGETQTVSTGASGKFSVPVKTATKVTVYFEALADEQLGVSAVKAQADVSRELATTVKKLGGGRVKLKVRGAGKLPLKLYILDSSGYELSGVKPKKADRAGSAVFDLGNMHGEFSYYVDAGIYGDLFWEGTRGTFHA